MLFFFIFSVFYAAKTIYFIKIIRLLCELQWLNVPDSDFYVLLH